MDDQTQQCPNCFEQLSYGEDGSLGLVPRLLDCGHCVCSECTADLMIEHGEGHASIYCPSCGHETICSVPSVDALPIAPASPLMIRLEQTMESPLSPDDRLHGSSSGEINSGDSRTRAASSESGSSWEYGGGGTSNLAAFMSTLTSTLKDDDDLLEDIKEEGGGAVVRDSMKSSTQCLVIGCERERLKGSYVCRNHHSQGVKVSTKGAQAMVSKISGVSTYRIVVQGDEILHRDEHQEPSMESLRPDLLRDLFIEQKTLDEGSALYLIDKCTDMLKRECNMLQIKAPVRIVGDLHGQFYDLISIFDTHGDPYHQPDGQYLFLGDYVDRGDFSCEIVLYLMALKLACPKSIHLIRGNHECRSLTSHFGFKDECKAKYGKVVYNHMLLLFESMPLCALVQNSHGQYFCTHGGISPDLRDLKQIDQINRLAEPGMTGLMCDLMWADPADDPGIMGSSGDNLSAAEMENLLNCDFQTNELRGCSFKFGCRAARRFLKDNRLLTIIRAHAVQEEGYYRHFEFENDKPSEELDKPDMAREKRHQKSPKQLADSANRAALDREDNLNINAISTTKTQQTTPVAVTKKPGRGGGAAEEVKVAVAKARAGKAAAAAASSLPPRPSSSPSSSSATAPALSTPTASYMTASPPSPPAPTEETGTIIPPPSPPAPTEEISPIIPPSSPPAPTEETGPIISPPSPPAPTEETGPIIPPPSPPAPTEETGPIISPPSPPAPTEETGPIILPPSPPAPTEETPPPEPPPSPPSAFRMLLHRVSNSFSFSFMDSPPPTPAPEPAPALIPEPAPALTSLDRQLSAKHVEQVSPPNSPTVMSVASPAISPPRSPSPRAARSQALPAVMTVFSAPNYCGRYGNKAAVLLITWADLEPTVNKYECVEHPSVLERVDRSKVHILALLDTCPYMPTSFRDFVRVAIKLGPAPPINDDVGDEGSLRSESNSVSPSGRRSSILNSNDNNNNLFSSSSMSRSPGGDGDSSSGGGGGSAQIGFACNSHGTNGRGLSGAVGVADDVVTPPPHRGPNITGTAYSSSSTGDNSGGGMDEGSSDTCFTPKMGEGRHSAPYYVTPYPANNGGRGGGGNDAVDDSRSSDAYTTPHMDDIFPSFHVTPAARGSLKELWRYNDPNGGNISGGGGGGSGGGLWSQSSANGGHKSASSSPSARQTSSAPQTPHRARKMTPHDMFEQQAAHDRLYELHPEKLDSITKELPMAAEVLAESKELIVENIITLSVRELVGFFGIGLRGGDGAKGEPKPADMGKPTKSVNEIRRMFEKKATDTNTKLDRADNMVTQLSKAIEAKEKKTQRKQRKGSFIHDAKSGLGTESVRKSQASEAFKMFESMSKSKRQEEVARKLEMAKKSKTNRQGRNSLLATKFLGSIKKLTSADDAIGMDSPTSSPSSLSNTFTDDGFFGSGTLGREGGDDEGPGALQEEGEMEDDERSGDGGGCSSGSGSGVISTGGNIEELVRRASHEPSREAQAQQWRAHGKQDERVKRQRSAEESGNGIISAAELKEELRIDNSKGANGAAAGGGGAGGGEGGWPASPVYIQPGEQTFSHAELLGLKLLFSLMDQRTCEYIDSAALESYAVEDDDVALTKEVQACIAAADADQDGHIGLMDFICFAARLKCCYERGWLTGL